MLTPPFGYVGRYIHVDGVQEFQGSVPLVGFVLVVY